MEESISVRVTRLNNLIVGYTNDSSKFGKPIVECLAREGLLDAFCLLYNECDKDNLKKRDKNILEFVNKCNEDNWPIHFHSRALISFLPIP